MALFLDKNGSKGGTALLTLPRVAKEEKDDLVLMQLPSSLNVKTMFSSSPRFVTTDSTNDNNDDAKNNNSSQVCLVTNNQSFAMSRVETSNAWIMVEPDAGGGVERPTKRLKAALTNQSNSTSTTTTLTPVKAKCMGNGSGAFFWELKERSLDKAQVRKLLTVWNPYNNNNNNNNNNKNGGTSPCTLQGLSQRLCFSPSQVQQALRRLHAVCINGTYVLVGEEAQREAQQAVIATLLEECDGFSTDGIEVDRFVPLVMERMSERYDGLEQVIEQHTLPRLSVAEASPIRNALSVVRLDFQKVRKQDRRGLGTKSKSSPVQFCLCRLLSLWYTTCFVNIANGTRHACCQSGNPRSQERTMCRQIG